MIAFRPGLVAFDTRPLSESIVAEIISQVLAPGHFLVCTSTHLTWRQVDEVPFWEVFLGRALDQNQTRERQSFRSWWVEIQGGDPNEPLLAIRWDFERGQLYVTRAIQIWAHVAFDDGSGAIETREAPRWSRELVGTIQLSECRTAGRLRDELAGHALQAIVGTSRLPLTSVESPLPQFSLGQIGYLFSSEPGAEARLRLERLKDPQLTPFERARLLEFALRAADDDDVPSFAESLLAVHADHGYWLELLAEMFNGVSLSPYTGLVTRTLALLRRLTRTEQSARVDFLARLVRLIDRHLTAYDLVKFHHRGANYPDALLLAELWRELADLYQRSPELFGFSSADGRVRRRRRALRHGILLQLEYAGHPVPDFPTSIGENARVMPHPFGRLPEEQIHAPQRRTRRLFDDPLPRHQTIWDLFDDLDDPLELRELGIALFLNRPFGIGKLPGEPDRTPMFSHLLFSRSVALRRLFALSRTENVPMAASRVDAWIKSLESLPMDGRPLSDAGPPPRPGVVSLHDALLTADDWLLLRTTKSSLATLEAAFDWAPLILAPAREFRLLEPSTEELIAYAADGAEVFRLSPDLSQGYVSRGGVELPAAGLEVSSSGNNDPVVILPAID
jgi:hypothetical protein